MKYGRQCVNVLDWECLVDNDANGFARVLSISRNFGGTLYFNAHECETWMFPGPKSRCMQLAPEKAAQFALESSDSGMRAYAYRPHNIDKYPGALFLRNWGVLYMNEVIKELTGK